MALIGAAWFRQFFVGFFLAACTVAGMIVVAARGLFPGIFPISAQAGWIAMR